MSSQNARQDLSDTKRDTMYNAEDTWQGVKYISKNLTTSERSAVNYICGLHPY